MDNYTYDALDNNSGARTVTWWVLEKTEDGEDGRTFSHEEEKLFIDFTLRFPNNFPGRKNALKADNDDAPTIEIYDMMEINGQPSTIVLRQNPAEYKNIRTRVMDVRLVPIHKYDLPFDVIGDFDRY